jgi:hypothetical protein
MGLRVIRTDGSPVGFVASLTRNTVRLAELSMTALLSTVLVFLFPLTIIALIAPLIFMMRSPSRQRLGDIAADTQVIKIRGTITTSRVVTSGYGFDQPAYDFDDRSWLRRRRGSQSPDPKGSSASHLAEPGRTLGVMPDRPSQVCKNARNVFRN